MFHGEQRRFCIEGTFLKVRDLITFAKECVSPHFSVDETNAIGLAIAEAATNAIRHGIHDNSLNTIELHIELREREFRFILFSHGHEFDIYNVPPPPTNLDNLETIPEGGWGIFLIRSIMDQIWMEQCSGILKLNMSKGLSEENISQDARIAVSLSDKIDEIALRDIQISADLHRRLMPEKMPTIKGLNIYAQSLWAKSLGGDYIGFHQESEDVLWFMVCDAMGKGVTAAFFSVLCHMTFQTILRLHQGTTPGELLSLTNHIMFEEFDKFGMFITAIVGRINVTNNELSYASAGHTPPLLYFSGEIELLDAPDFMMGVERNTRYSTCQLPFLPNMSLLCYTDGLTDIIGNDGEIIGIEPLICEAKKLLKTNNIENTCKTLIKHATNEQNDSIKDDITILGIHRL